MKTYYLIVSLAFFSLISCQSQDMNIFHKKGKKPEPKEKITVSKKYDKNGNLIELDSIYSAYYSNYEGDTIGMDSTMQNFEMFFNHHFPLISSNIFMDMDSSIMMPGCFHDDFFEHQFMKQDKQLLDMMRSMDSIKNEFFRYQFEPIVQKKP